VQIARALRRDLAALDVDPRKLDAMAANGAALTVNVREVQGRTSEGGPGIREKNGCPDTRMEDLRVFRDRRRAGNRFGLLNTARRCRSSASPWTRWNCASRTDGFPRRAVGNWGCLTELYPQALDLVLDGKIALAPFVERHPLSDINEVFAAATRAS